MSDGVGDAKNRFSCVAAHKLFFACVVGEPLYIESLTSDHFCIIGRFPA